MGRDSIVHAYSLITLTQTIGVVAKLKLVVIVAAKAAEERIWPDVAAGGDDGKAKVGRTMGHGRETEASDDDGRRGARLAQSHGLFPSRRTVLSGACVGHLQLRFLGHVWKEVALWWLHLSYITMHMFDNMSET
jgi:hypothetical protein